MSNLFFLFILTIIIAAFVGMSIVLRILRSISFMGMSYGPPAVAASGDFAKSKSGSGFGGTLLLLIIVSAIFWLLFTKSQQSTDSDSDQFTPETEQKESPRHQESRIVQPPKTYNSSGNVDVPVIRVNQKPFRPATTMSGYAIQVAAHSDYSGAVAVTDGLSRGRTHIVHDDDGLYKVFIIGFSTRSAANRYLKIYDLDGFVRKLE